MRLPAPLTDTRSYVLQAPGDLARSTSPRANKLPTGSVFQRFYRGVKSVTSDACGAAANSYLPGCLPEEGQPLPQFRLLAS